MPDEEPDHKKIESASLTMIHMIEHIVEVQCKEGGLPLNVMCSLHLHMAENALCNSVEELVNTGRFDMAQTYIGVMMRSVQEFVKLAEKASKEINEIKLKENGG